MSVNEVAPPRVDAMSMLDSLLAEEHASAIKQLVWHKLMARQFEAEADALREQVTALQQVVADQSQQIAALQPAPDPSEPIDAPEPPDSGVEEATSG